MSRLVVAGHLCLDLIPAIPPQEDSLRSLMAPGKLVDVGPVSVSTGGGVANTGLALARLGAPVRLVGLVGDDAFGREVAGLLARGAPGDAPGGDGPLVETALVVDPGAATSYTIVLNVPGADRVFLHCPGANDRFGPETVPDGAFAGAGWFHFGYPPLMARFHREADAAARLFRRARAAGLPTSLDMARPDPASEAGRVDWRAWLGHVLPWVDVFAPSFDELHAMLRPGDGAPAPSAALGRELAGECLAMGAALVAVKLGTAGLLLRGHAAVERWAAPAWPTEDAAAGPGAWRGVDRHGACFAVDCVGATGAGDCAVAGLLYAIRAGFGPERALEAALAVGACSVEALDAVSGVPSWERVAARLAAGWARREAAG